MAPATLAHAPKLLFIDAFDSFSNNITGLLERCLGAQVTIVHIDDEAVDRAFDDFVQNFDAVVVGPGPGHPANHHDVGFINKLWHLDDTHLLPVLGICLGFQSLCLAHGADVKRLKQARHGIVTRVSHCNSDIWDGINDCNATQYHSLHVDLKHGSTLKQQSRADAFWEPTAACPSLLPLAWDLSDALNGPILSSVRHTTKPFWGVQFHPESISTSDAGRHLIDNWWLQARMWLSERSRTATSPPHVPIPSSSHHSSLMYGYRKGGSNSFDSECTTPGSSGYRTSLSHLSHELLKTIGESEVDLHWESVPNTYVTPTDVLERLDLRRDEVVMLDSQGHATGRYSILGLVIPGKTMKVTYKVGDRALKCGTGCGIVLQDTIDSIDDVWPILQEATELHRPKHSRHIISDTDGSGNCLSYHDDDLVSDMPARSPFWGGFMGYISYEAGLETINVEIHDSCAINNIPDLNFAFIHRSIVIDHEEARFYVQSLLPQDDIWIKRTAKVISSLNSRHAASVTEAACSIQQLKEQANLDAKLSMTSVRRPLETTYRTKVLQCQDFLRSGDSYELCLTDETDIVSPAAGSARIDEWALYKRLRSKNPAPFGAFLRLSGVTVVGSSPERFLRWTRDGRCQFRPIKGTVKKSVSMTRERAHEILGSSKERAENLMIVDLIRHDLAGVIGAANSWVSKLMAVEEYETVYQLVSVIEGQIRKSTDDDSNSAPRGVDVLKASLPPGSMTGAPKKRSCEILRDIEKRPRGVYSGVLGYLDVGGAGDFSVVIRTLVRGANDVPQDHDMNGCNNGDRLDHISKLIETASPPETETWRVGAGGAVTIQSSDEGEFQEMEAKASSVLGALFGQEKR